VAALALVACAGDDPPRPQADADLLARGARALERHGCGACHTIDGIAGADGIVGPPLVDMARRVYIGRGLPNTVPNLVRWITDPQTIAPGSAMPDMQVSPMEARAIAAWLRQAD
jgi:mono/diheme cytochrome c family protein